jgi:hypothetical protein
MTLRFHTLILCVVMTAVSGCFVFSPQLTVADVPVLLLNDNPTLYGLGSDNAIGDSCATFTGRTMDTVMTRGSIAGLTTWGRYFIVEVGGVRRCLRDCEPVNQYFLEHSCGPEFTVAESMDCTCWGRATYFLAHREGMKIELASTTILETNVPRDTASCGFILTRVPNRGYSLYSIQCKEHRRSRNCPDAVARFAFYIQKGWEYVPQ